MILAQMQRLKSQALLDKFSEGNRWIYLAVAVVLLVALFAIVLKIKEWLRPKGLAENSPEQLLMQFRDIHKQGELSADEYKNIRERLTKKSGESGRAGDASSGPSADDSAGSSSAIQQ